MNVFWFGCSGVRFHALCRNELDCIMVDADIHSEHLQQGATAPRQPLDVPWRERPLHSFRDLGPHRTRTDVRATRCVQQPQLVLPGGDLGPRAAVRGHQALPPMCVAKVGEHPRPPNRRPHHAPRITCQQHHVARHGHGVQRPRVPPSQIVVETLQLRPLGCP